MKLSIEQWHERYSQQARWTQSIRHYLYQKTHIQDSRKILDIGCGTGILDYELTEITSAQVFGIDIDAESLKYAHHHAPTSHFNIANCLSLPYFSDVFDTTLCHFLLLWVNQYQNTIHEMVRVTRANGFVMAMAEPDYGGRIDFPDELSLLGSWQTESLIRQGANPYIGRRLRYCFSKAGLADIEVGVLGGQWDIQTQEREDELEWMVIESDLQDVNDDLNQLNHLKALDMSSRKACERVLFVPVFYAIGRVQK